MFQSRKLSLLLKTSLLESCSTENVKINDCPCRTISLVSFIMVQLTIPQGIWVCIEMGRVNNAHEIRRSWRNRWPGHPAPTVRTIIKNYEKYLRHGTSQNRNRGRNGRPRSGRSTQNVLRVQRASARNGAVFSRQNGRGLRRNSFSRITRFEIRFHPYVLIRRQELRPVDPPQRLAFCNWLVNYFSQNPGFLNNLVSSDEAVFSLNSEVNTHSVIRYARYGQGHPQDHYKVLIKYWFGSLHFCGVISSRRYRKSHETSSQRVANN